MYRKHDGVYTAVLHGVGALGCAATATVATRQTQPHIALVRGNRTSSSSGRSDSSTITSHRARNFVASAAFPRRLCLRVGVRRLPLAEVAVRLSTGAILRTAGQGGMGCAQGTGKALVECAHERQPRRHHERHTGTRTQRRRARGPQSPEPCYRYLTRGQLGEVQGGQGSEHGPGSDSRKVPALAG